VDTDGTRGLFGPRFVLGGLVPMTVVVAFQVTAGERVRSSGNGVSLVLTPKQQKEVAMKMERRVFVIQAGTAFPVVAGALYLIGCGHSSTSPSAVADISSTSTLDNGHSHSVNVPAYEGDLCK